MKAIDISDAIQRIIKETQDTVNNACLACNCIDDRICENCIGTKLIDTIYNLTKGKENNGNDNIAKACHMVQRETERDT